MNAVVSALAEPGCPRLFEMFAENMKAALSKQQTVTFCQAIVAELGSVSGVSEPRKDGSLEVYTLKAERGQWTLRVAWNDAGRITGLIINDPVPIPDECSEMLTASPSPNVAAYLDCRRTDDVVAAGLWVYTGGDTAWRAATGQRAKGAPEEVTVNDQWHIGSCGKAMTASLAGVLVQEGIIEWDTTICDALEGVVSRIHNDYCNVTLEQLLAHQGGLPANVPDQIFQGLRRSWDTEAQEDRLRIARTMLAESPAQKPGSGMLYSNVGYIISALMVETAAEVPWEQLIASKVFEPLGMDTAGFGPPRGEQPQGHNPTNGEPVGMRDNPAAYTAAGGIHLSLDDWGRFVVEHIKAERGEGALLGVETAGRLHAPFKDSDYALGWVAHERTWADGLVLWHMGSNTFWYSYVSVAPDKDFAVLAVTNVGSPAGARMLQSIGEDFRKVLVTKD